MIGVRSAAAEPVPAPPAHTLREHVRAYMAGPGSAAWQVNREVAVLLGWPAAVFLQVAHPLVAAAVLEHSTFMRDASSRFARLLSTIRSMQELTFGDEDSILRTADTINRIHDRVHGALTDDAGGYPAGEPYSAHDPGLLLWVHVTLLYVLPRTYHLLIAPLSPAQRDRYCREAVGLGPLLGIPMETMPRTATEVETLLHEAIDAGAVVVTPAARRIVAEALDLRGASRAVVHHLAGVPPRAIAPLIYAAFAPVLWLPMLTARCLMGTLLPVPIAQAYGFPSGRVASAAAIVTAAAVRVGVRLLPPPLRYWSVARRALRRAA